MPADKSAFLLKLSARLDETSEHLSRVEDDVLGVKRATHALANTVDRLAVSTRVPSGRTISSTWRKPLRSRPMSTKAASIPGRTLSTLPL